MITYTEFSQGRTKLNSDCVSLNSDKNSNDIGPPTERPTGPDRDAVEDDYEELVPFNPRCYPDGVNDLIYIRPSSSPPNSR